MLGRNSRTRRILVGFLKNSGELAGGQQDASLKWHRGKREGMLVSCLIHGPDNYYIILFPSIWYLVHRLKKIRQSTFLVS